MRKKCEFDALMENLKCARYTEKYPKSEMHLLISLGFLNQDEILAIVVNC